MKQTKWALSFVVIGSVVFSPACDRAGVPAKRVGEGSAETLGEVSAKPQYYYDLGQASADVSGYPKKEQENYRLFLAICGACHTVARPLNAPYIKEAEWKRFVRRMHLKMEGRGIALNQLDEERIVSFLVYDSQARKVESRQKFEETQADLQRRFQEANNAR